MHNRKPIIWLRVPKNEKHAFENLSTEDKKTTKFITIKN
jgi:hypothetical protein